MINQSIVAAGPTHTTFTQENLEKVFSGVLHNVKISKEKLHEDKDERGMTVLTDDEHPAVFYGKSKNDPPASIIKKL